jgi:hypothetical protein
VISGSGGRSAGSYGQGDRQPFIVLASTLPIVSIGMVDLWVAATIEDSQK